MSNFGYKTNNRVPIEIEVKLLINKDVIKRLEKKLGCFGGISKWKKQENIVYRTENGFIRFRREDEAVTLTIKGKRLPGEYNERSEIEREIPIDFFDYVLKYVSNDAVVYEKQRASYNYNGCVVCLDNLNGQYFVEIEGTRELIDKNIVNLRLKEFPKIKKDYAQIVAGGRR